MRRIVIAPIGRLAEAVREVASGDFDRPVEPSGPREVAALGTDVEAMRERIVAEVAALRDAERRCSSRPGSCSARTRSSSSSPTSRRTTCRSRCARSRASRQLLERRYKGQLDERADRYIAFAVDGAKRMQELINDLLAFSRVGRLAAPHERVDTDGAARRRPSRGSPRRSRSRRARSIADELPTVAGDAGAAGRACSRTCSPTRSSSAATSRRASASTPSAQGASGASPCTDDGIGIEDEYAERIFVIFQRLHTREAYEGTGIGLAMCRKIVEYHGGRIWLAPSEPGRGAQFVFTLPADDPHEEEPAS